MTLHDLCRPLHVGSALANGFILAAIDEQKQAVVLERAAERLAVCLRERDDKAARYDATTSFNLVYLGKAGQPLEPSARQALHELVSIFKRNDRGEPLDQAPPSRLVGVLRSLRDASETRGEIALTLLADTPDAIFVDVETAARLHAQRLILAGGPDPLVHPHGLEAVRLARTLGFSEVEVETAEPRLAERAFAERAIGYGITRFRLHPHADIDGVIATLRKLGAPFYVINRNAVGEEKQQ